MHHRTTIIGRIGQDPEIRYMPSGGAVANFSVAANETWKDKQTGEKREHTEWYRCAAFGKLAELIGEYRKKGDLVFIEGKNRTRSYEKDGEKRYATELIVDTMRGLSGARSASSSGQGQGQGQAPSGQEAPSGAAQDDDFDDDIPF